MSLVNSLALINDAICDNFMKAVTINRTPGVWAPIFNSDGTLETSFCNYFCAAVALDGADYGEFWPSGKTEPLLMNDMISLVESSQKWLKEATPDLAQTHVNQGSLTFAFWKNPTGHGHGCPLRVGQMTSSGKWGLVPRCANVGKDVFIDRGINFAFAEMPAFYTLVSTLSS